MTRFIVAPMGRRKPPGDLPNADLPGNARHHDRRWTHHEVPHFPAVFDDHEPIYDGKGHSRNLQFVGT